KAFLDFYEHGFLDLENVARKSMQPLDAMLRVAPVLAHVPFAGGAIEAGHGIGMAHDADDAVAALEAAAPRRLEHLAQRLMADGESLLSCGGFAVVRRDEFPVGAADAHGDGLHEELAGGGPRHGQLVQSQGAGPARLDCYASHAGETSSI